MKKITPIIDRRSIENEAAEWIVKLDSETPLSDPDRQALTEWLSRSPVHRQELNDLNAFWSNNILTELLVPSGKHRRQSKPGLFSYSSSLARQLWGFNPFIAAATLCVLGIAIALTILALPEPLEKTNGIYVTALGQQKTVSLADGSVVQLNTNSQIEVAYGKQYRNIRLLQGEVHFEVSKKPELPFRVYAGTGRVQAVGTAFTVYLRDKAVNVLVTEGRVALASLGRPDMVNRESSPIDGNKPSTPETMASNNVGGGTVIDAYTNSRPRNIGVLNANQSITLSMIDNSYGVQKEMQEAVEIIKPDELARRQSWRDGMLVFSGETLEQAVAEISRYTTISIEIVGQEVQEIPIGGRFKVGEIDDMFNALESNFGLQVDRLGYNRVRLSLAP